LDYLSQIRQIGIATGFNNELDMRKVDTLVLNAKPNPAGSYAEVGNLLRAGGDYYVLIERANTDTNAGENETVAQIGNYPPASANDVVVANRGATLDGRPVRMRVFLWK